jgi:5'-3' exonuclease
VKTVLVDGDSVLVRACRAVRSRRLEPPAEAAVFLGSFLRLVREEKPDALMVGWDSGGDLWRREVFPGYKGERRGAGILGETRSIAELVLTDMQIAQDVFPGCEADDVVAAYSHIAREAGDVVIISGDMDLLQLCEEGTRMRLIRSASADDWWDCTRIRTQLGCPPRWLPRVAALAGDKSDCIPGIRGIGRTRALQMLAQANGDIEIIDWKNDEDYRTVLRWLSLTDLDADEAISRYPEPHHIPEFQPVTSPQGDGGLQLLETLREFGMTRAEAALTDGTLWPGCG